MFFLSFAAVVGALNFYCPRTCEIACLYARYYFCERLQSSFFLKFIIVGVLYAVVDARAILVIAYNCVCVFLSLLMCYIFVVCDCV